jgi:hypothetical protein
MQTTVREVLLAIAAGVGGGACVRRGSGPVGGGV